MGWGLYQCCRHSSLINTQTIPLLNNIFFKMEQFHYSKPQGIQTPDSDTIKFQYKASKLLRLKEKKVIWGFFFGLINAALPALHQFCSLLSPHLTGCVSMCPSWLGQAVLTLTKARTPHPHLVQDRNHHVTMVTFLTSSSCREGTEGGQKKILVVATKHLMFFLRFR